MYTNVSYLYFSEENVNVIYVGGRRNNVSVLQIPSTVGHVFAVELTANGPT